MHHLVADGALRRVPRHLLNQGVVLSDRALLNSVRVVGGPGSGKSRFAARTLVLQRLVRGRPTIVIDPTGGIVANLLDVISRQPAAAQALLWPRIHYVDMAADDFVSPMPLYWRRRPHEPLLTTASRLLEVIRRLDPHLQSASVEGWNALYEVGTAAGMMAVALGQQVTEVADMVRHPTAWKGPFKFALRQHADELQLAHTYFEELKGISNPELRKRRTSSFLIKLIPFLADRSMRATFAADRPAFDLDQMVAQGRLVLYDFQGEQDPARRRLKLLWVFTSVVEFAKQRGLAGRDQTVLLLIDEITQLLGQNPLEQAVMADDFNELITVVARNYGMPVCLMHQNLSQLDERTQVSLAQIGTQIIGWLQEPADCLRLAQQFFRYAPDWVRKTDPVWMGVPQAVGTAIISQPMVIDTTTTEYGIEEQLYLLADRFRTLGRFRFLVRLASGEGQLAQALRPMSIAQLHVGQYPNAALVDEMRRRLRKRDGVAVSDLLAQIDARQQTRIHVQPAQEQGQHSSHEDDTITQDDHHHAPTTHSPVSASPPDIPDDADDVADENGPLEASDPEQWKDDLFSPAR